MQRVRLLNLFALIGALLACGCSGRGQAAVDVVPLGAAHDVAKLPLSSGGCFWPSNLATYEAHLDAQRLGLMFSPSGRFRVSEAKYPDPKTRKAAKALAIADLDRDVAELWLNVTPLMWSAARDELVYEDQKGDVIVASLSAQGALFSPPLQRRLDVEAKDILHAQDGWLFLKGDDRSVNLVSTTGSRLALPILRAPSAFGVSCKASGQCSPYVEVERRAPDGRTWRQLSLVEDGQRIDFEIDGDELAFVSVTSDRSKAFVLARKGAIRGLWTVDRQGRMEPAGPQTNLDVRNAVVGADGAVKELVFFTAPDGISHPEGRLLRVTPGGAEVVEYRPQGQSAWLSVKSGNKVRKVTFGCSAVEGNRGKPLEAIVDGGDRTYGFAYQPPSPPIGVVAYHHGGIYQAFDGYADAVTQALLAKGYAVIEVNARGTPGYGTAYLSAGYGAAYSQMAKDGAALVAALAQKDSSSLPAFLVGVSGGGQPVLAGLSDAAANWKGGLLLSAACDWQTQDHDTYRPEAEAQWRSPSYLKVVAKIIRPGDSASPHTSACKRHLADAAPLLIAYGEDDQVVDPRWAKAFASQNKVSVMPFPGAGHVLSKSQIRAAVDAASQLWSASPPSGR